MTNLWQSFTTAAPDLLRTMARQEVQTTIFILVLLAADSLLRRPSPRFRYALWLVALAKALWPPFLSLPALDFTSRQPVITETFGPVTPFFEAPVIQAPLMEMPATQTPVSVAPLTEASAPVLTWGAVFLGVWLVLALAIVTLMIVNFVRFRLRLRPPHVEPYHFEESESAVGRPWPPIWATDRIHSPLTMGLLRPRIYLTWKVIASGARALRAILYHELAHIIRRDGWITLLQAAALVIHPFNPLVWLMNARLSRYREQLCDDFALRHTGVAPRDYGNLLLDQLSEAKVPLLAVHTPTYFFETKRDLVHRLHQLMKRKGELMNPITSPQKILLAGLMAGLLIIASQCSMRTVPLTQQAAVEESTEGWYARWGFPVAESTHVKVVLYDPNADQEVAVLFDGTPGEEHLITELLPEGAEGLLVPVGGYWLYFVTTEGREFRGVIPVNWPSKIRTYPADSHDADVEVAEPDFSTEITTFKAPDGVIGIRIIVAFAGAGNHRIAVYDVEGNELAELFNGYHDAGESSAAWDGTTADGNPVSPGVYFIRITGSSGPRTIRFVLPDSLEAKTTIPQQPAPTGAASERPKIIPFIPYDEAPVPIGGYAAVQQQVAYPEEAQTAGVQGTVVVYAFIDKNGRVGETMVLQGIPGLDEAATAAVKNTTFEPAKYQGEIIGVWMSIPVIFRLDE